MKQYVFIILAVVFAVSLFGCGKKNIPEAGTPEAMSLEAMNALNANLTAPAPVAEAKPQVTQPPTPVETKTAPGPVSAATKPSIKEIQTALKNAGYYAGSIDGKLGPKTKKAIEEFQKANDLKVDGKVGAKTWNLLSRHLNVAAETKTPAAR
jgi:peptidoglycan hydrolase-like protein with peptidoglycan-binding domain